MERDLSEQFMENDDCDSLQSNELDEDRPETQWESMIRCSIRRSLLRTVGNVWELFVSHCLFSVFDMLQHVLADVFGDQFFWHGCQRHRKLFLNSISFDGTSDVLA